MTDKQIAKNITSYDFIKTLAVIIMIIDHLGSYMFVDIEVLRAIGRICFPIWFFLAGYARTRTIPKKLWFAAFGLVFFDILVGRPILALNALFTIIFIRLVIDYIFKSMQKSAIQFCIISIYLVLLIYPSRYFFEYGTMAFITAIYGCLVRNKNEYFGKKTVTLYMLFSFVCFVISMQMSFKFTMINMIIMAAGTLFVRMYLLDFKLVKYPLLTNKLPALAREALQYCGRNTLDIYVIHLIVLKIYYLLFVNQGYWKPFSFQFF